MVANSWRLCKWSARPHIEKDAAGKIFSILMLHAPLSEVLRPNLFVAAAAEVNHIFPRQRRLLVQRLLDRAVACGIVLILVGAFALSLGFFGSPVGRAYFDDEVRGKYAAVGQKAPPRNDFSKIFGGPEVQTVEGYAGRLQPLPESSGVAAQNSES